ncbi:IS21 family transposase [Burkholderiaceae bacterium DAT-1]|nr:IS21 family transposase [Burkholderiaceae bacterium DAT-1]
MIHKIKALYDEGRGLSIRGIAQELALSRNTVRKYLNLSVEDISVNLSQTSRHKLLDDYKPFVISLLQGFPSLSAVKIERRLREQFPELDCSRRTLRRYVSALKEQVCVKQPRYYQPVVDMVPGHQCQVDLGELRDVSIGGVLQQVYFVVFVLSYSRLMYVTASLKPVDTSIFIRMHDAAFRYFGGCPHECVYDQTKLVVIREEFRELTLNSRFAEYATRAGFTIRACEGYDPESKGKVEAGVKYVKHDGFYGETFHSAEDLHGYLATWLDEVANQRRHGITGESPRDRFDREESDRLAGYIAPADHPDGHETVTRQVDRTGLISWAGNRYSVPMHWQRQAVSVRDVGTHIIVLGADGQEIARHERLSGKGGLSRNTDHYRNKETTIRQLETDIRDHMHPLDSHRLLALIRHTSPAIYKDQLAGIRQILRQHQTPIEPEQLDWICDRPVLTATRFRELLAVAPDMMSRRKEQSVPVSTGVLSRYAGVAGGKHAHV